MKQEDWSITAETAEYRRARSTTVIWLKFFRVGNSLSKALLSLETNLRRII